MGKRMDLAPEQVITGFGERLSTLRKAAGFTQTELALGEACAFDIDMQGIAFSNALFLPHGTPNTAAKGRNTAPDAHESVFGCNLKSAGDLSGVDGPAKMRLPMVPSTGYPLPSGPFHRARKPSGAADPSGPGRRVA